MKKVCLLRGSPRKHGNTNALLIPLVDEFKKCGCEIEDFDLYTLDIQPCLACRKCQDNWSTPNCVHSDDMQSIFSAILGSDLILLATPIYSWYCTPPMKAALDRLVYAMNKYYGMETGPSLWAGKSVAVVATCGYPPEKGADLFEEGIKRYCKHSNLKYLGMACERHLGYATKFMDDQKASRMQEFAKSILI